MQRRVDVEKEGRPEPVGNEEGRIAEQGQDGHVEAKEERLWSQFRELMIRVPGTALFFGQLYRESLPALRGKEFPGG